MKRIGMLTSGGDCQSLNATMRGVVKGLNVLEGTVEIYGFIDGYKGLIYGNYKRLTAKDFSGILTTGGTILGTSRQPFKLMRTPDENGLDKVEAMKATYHYLDLDCLVILGGNGSQKTANLLREEGLNIVSLPKTIDNDLWGTDMTFGFQSAVDIATSTIDCIHTTAASHNRVFIVELMGHKVGWVTLHAGIAGGADIILIPEIPYDLKHVISAINAVTNRENTLQFLLLQKVPSQKKMQNSPRNSTRPNSLNANTPQLVTNSLPKSRKQLDLKFVSLFRDIHSVVEALFLLTVLSPAVLVLQPQNLLRKKTTAKCLS